MVWGVNFDFSRLGRVPDTREAPRLVALAAREVKQSEVADGLFRAFFEQGTRRWRLVRLSRRSRERDGAKRRHARGVRELGLRA